MIPRDGGGVGRARPLSQRVLTIFTLREPLGVQVHYNCSAESDVGLGDDVTRRFAGRRGL